MSNNCAFPEPKVMSGAVPWGGSDALMRTSGEPDSRQLHTIMAGLAMRAAERQEVIENPKS